MALKLKSMIAIATLSLLPTIGSETPAAPKPAATSAATRPATKPANKPATATAATPAADKAATTPAAADDTAKVLYAVGAALAVQLQVLNLTEAETEQVKNGLSDTVRGKLADDLLQTWGPRIRSFAQERMQASTSKERQAGAEYQAKVAAEPGIKTLTGGVLFKELAAGTGAQPTASDTVRFHYRGTLISGKVFESSIESGHPAEFALGEMAPCLGTGFQQMKVGGKARLVCPADQAYGDQGSPPLIRPGATLVFEVELLGIVAPPPKETPPAAGTTPAPAPQN